MGTAELEELAMGTAELEELAMGALALMLEDPPSSGLEPVAYAPIAGLGPLGKLGVAPALARGTEEPAREVDGPAGGT
jgi:hypothetical protein